MNTFKKQLPASNMLLGILLISVLPYLIIGEPAEPTSTRPGCIHNDGTYHPLGSSFRPNPCEHCMCPDEGGPTVCAFVDCLGPPCVDATKGKDDCCYECQNGENCYLNGKIIPAGQDFEVGEMTCRCPHLDPMFGAQPVDIQAQCSPSHPDSTGPPSPRV